MADSMDQLEQLERRLWREAIDSVDDALAPEWESAQSDIDLMGDLPGRLAAAVRNQDPDLRSLAEKLAVLTGHGDHDPAALVDAYLKKPGTGALSVLAGYILAKGEEEADFYEGTLRPMLLAKLTPESVDISTTGDTPTTGNETAMGDTHETAGTPAAGDNARNGVDRQAWLQVLFLAMRANDNDPPAEWLTSARAYFDQRIGEFTEEASKGLALRRPRRKEQFESKLSPQEKALYVSSQDLQARVNEALAAGTSEEHSSRSVQARRLAAGGLALLALLAVVAVILAFVFGWIPWPFEPAETTAVATEAPKPGATTEPTTGAGALETTPTISGGEELTPELPPTSAPAAGELAADGQGWLCAAGAEWRQLVTVTNTGEAETTYTIAVSLGDQPGGTVHLPPESPGGCGLAEPSPEIVLEPGADAQRLLIFPNASGGGQSLRAELLKDGAETAMFQVDLPEPQALSVSLARPEDAPEAHVFQEGVPQEVPFLLQANSPGEYTLACAPEDGDAPGEGTPVTVIDINVPVEVACTIDTEQPLEEAGNWRASVFPLPLASGGAEVAQAQDSANAFMVEPPSYDLEATPGEPLGIMWLDEDIDNNDQVGIVQIYELRNTGNLTYSLESRIEFTNGLRGFYGAAPWTADVPLDASFTLVDPINTSENGARIQLRDSRGNDYVLESLPYQLLSSPGPSVDNPNGSILISQNERLILEPCPDSTADSDDPTPECVVKFVMWFRATGMRGIKPEEPVEYSVTFRPVPDPANPESVAWDDPVPMLINSPINLNDQPDRVIELSD